MKNIKDAVQTTEAVSEKTGLKTKIIRAGHQVVFKTKKNSPELLLAGGLIGLAATGYLAFKSSAKINKILADVDESKDQAEQMADLVDEMKELRNNPSKENDERAEEVQEQFDDLHEQYDPLTRSELIWDFTKAVAAPVIVGSLSVAAIIWSHNIQYKRISALASSLATIIREQKAFESKYREKYGDKKWDEFEASTHEEEVETDDGKKVKVRAQDDKSDKGRWYEDSSEYVSDDHQYNLSRIDAVNEKFSNKYFANGYLVMNDVLEGLGFERTREGALIGWSGADVFEIGRRVTTVYNEQTGENEDKIYVYWPQPHYVYDEVHFSGRYAE